MRPNSWALSTGTPVAIFPLQYLAPPAKEAAARGLVQQWGIPWTKAVYEGFGHAYECHRAEKRHAPSKKK